MKSILRIILQSFSFLFQLFDVFIVVDSFFFFRGADDSVSIFSSFLYRAMTILSASSQCVVTAFCFPTFLI